MKRLPLVVACALAVGNASADVPSTIVPLQSRALATIEASGEPDFIVADGADAWVVNVGRMEQWAANSKKPKAIVRMPSPCGAPAMGFRSLWVADCKAGALYRIDPRTAKIRSKLATGVADPDGELSIAVGAGSVWLAIDSAGVISRIDPIAQKVTDRIDVLPGSYVLVFGFDALWVVNTGPKSGAEGSVQRINPANNQIVATIPVGRTARFAAAGAGAIWVQNQSDGTVSKIDPATNTVTATIKVGADLKYGDITASGDKVWVRTTGEQLLAVIDAKTNQIVERVGEPMGSGAARVAGERLWVTAHDVKKIWLLRQH